MQPNLTQGPVTAVPAQTPTPSVIANEKQTSQKDTTGTMAGGAPVSSAGHEEGGATASVPARATIGPALEIGRDKESGWAAIAKSIRDIDEQKIKDYKEDIDSILTFAGLYSAVLSALLVESYQALQPDPSTIMITLLGQLVSQTHAYTINNGYLNSTVPALDVSVVPLGFTPSLAAKRVNVLWFASLTLSLISASFGILVKQWLREYMTSESVSPLAQLQIRHFRAPALDDWRVFTIAALLPLILQVALALFFVGLCFFTLDIHQSIGYTTTPLVAGWAFLFLAASFAPTLSSRCPYKLPGLIPIMTLIRNRVFRSICWLKGISPAQGQTAGLSLSEWSWQSLCLDEKDAHREDPKRDIDILIKVDASHMDDRLVTNMCNALKETHTDPRLMIEFVLKIISSRLPIEFAERPLPLMLDLSQLPVRTCTILMDTIADVFAREVGKIPESDPIQWNNVTRDCMSLLFARLPCLLSDKAMEAVSLCFTGTQVSRPEGTLGEILTNVPPKDLQRDELQKREELCLHLLERLRNAFMHLNAWQLHSTISIMAKMCCCTCGGCKTFTDVVLKHSSATSSVLVRCMCDVLIGYMLRQVKDAVEWNEWHREILLSVVDRWAVTTGEPWYSALHELVRRLVTKPKYAPYFYRFLFHRIEYNHSAQRIFDDALISSNDLEHALINLNNVFTRYVDEMMQRPELLDEQFHVYLLRFLLGQMSAMESVVKSRKRSVVEEVYLPLWQKIWKTMHKVMSSPGSGVLAFGACQCLEKIDSLDEQWLLESDIGADLDKKPDQWDNAFDPAKSFFDDDIIQDLMNLLPSPELEQYKRVRRIFRNRELEEAKIKETTEEGGNGLDTDDDSADDDDADVTVADGQHPSAPLDGKNALLGVPHGHVGNFDARQADDRLAMKMCRPLKSMSSTPDFTINFVLKIIGIQLQTELERPLPPILDFSQLPAQVCTLLINNVAKLFIQEVKRFRESEPIERIGFIRDCLSILVARLPCPSPEGAMAAVSVYLPHDGAQSGIKLMSASAQPEEQQDLCMHLQHWLRNMYPYLDAAQFFATIFNMTKICCTCGGDCRNIESLLMNHADTISSSLEHHTCDVLAGFMLHQVQNGAQFDFSHGRIMSTLFGHWKVGAEDVPWHGALSELVRYLLVDPKVVPQLYPLFFHPFHYVDSAAPIFMDAFVRSRTKQRILVNMYNAFSTYVDSTGTGRVCFQSRFYLTLLWYVDGQMAPMMYAAKHEKRAVVEALYLPIWQLIWKKMHSALSGLERSDGTKELTEQACLCLQKIDKLDELWLRTSQTQAGLMEDFDQWVKAFNPAKSFFDDDLIEDLMKLLPESEDVEHRRVYRIRKLKRAQEEQLSEKANEDTDDASEDGYDDEGDNAEAGADDVPHPSPSDPNPNGHTNNSVPVSRRLDAKPDPGQLVEITHPAGTLHRGDTECTLVNDGAARHTADSWRTIQHVAP